MSVCCVRWTRLLGLYRPGLLSPLHLCQDSWTQTKSWRAHCSGLSSPHLPPQYSSSRSSRRSWSSCFASLVHPSFNFCCSLALCFTFTSFWTLSSYCMLFSSSWPRPLRPSFFSEVIQTVCILPGRNPKKRWMPSTDHGTCRCYPDYVGDFLCKNYFLRYGIRKLLRHISG